MRLVRVPLDSSLRPLEVLRTMRGDDRPFALIGRWAGGGAVLGSEPVRVAPADSDPFALLDDLPEASARDRHQPGLCLGVDGPVARAPLDVFAVAAGALEPDHAPFLAGPWGAIASRSPQLFLRRTGRSVVTAPIKGTHERRDPLVASQK